MIEYFEIYVIIFCKNWLLREAARQNIMPDHFKKEVILLFNALSFKGKILLLILPITILGLVILSGVSYQYVNSVLEKELLHGAVENTQEVALNIDAWLDARLLETQLAASNPSARNAVSDPAAASKNSEYRLQLLQKKYLKILA